MQITSGLISCDPLVDESLVTGNSSVDWTQVTVGSLLIVGGISYTITAVNSVTKTLNITPKWVGDAVSGVTYVIVRDFTMNRQLPLLNPGDLEAAAIFSRAMQILDNIQAEIASDPTVSDYPITQTGHGFSVGNVLRINGGTWALATSLNTTTSLAVGVVSRVVDANTFWVRTTGTVGSSLVPIYGISLVAGQIYYLREVPTPFPSVPTVNICTGEDVDTGSLKVPVLQAVSTNTAFIMGMAQASTNVFGANKAGLVPNPGTPSGKILYDTGWGSASGLADDSIQARHLDPTVPWVTDLASDLDWDNFRNQASATPIHAFIVDLHDRVKAAETSVSAGTYSRQVFTRKSHATGIWSWSVPPGVYWCKVTIYPGERMFIYSGNGRPAAAGGTVTQSIGPEARGISFRLNLEGVLSLSGEIRAYYCTMNYNGATPVVNVGWANASTTLRPAWDYPVIIGADGIVNQPGENRISEHPSQMLVGTSRPLVSPFIFYSGFTLSKSRLIQQHFPGASTIPEGTPSDASGYHLVSNNHPAVLSGAVVIETGLLI